VHAWKGEWELKDLVMPSKSVFVATYDNRADERLTYLSQRSYSSQWEIPESVNKKVVNELKDQFAGKVFPQEPHILVWNIDDLKAYCSAHAHACIKSLTPWLQAAQLCQVP